MSLFRRTIQAVAIAGWICTSCVSIHSSQEGVTPSAEIGADFARFVFPRESARTFTWHAPGVGKYTGTPDYFWGVNWYPPEQGEDPQQIIVILMWDSVGTRRGSLSDLVKAAKVEVLTLCLPCEPTALSIERDAVFKPPYVAASARNGGVVVTVRGRATIERLFPQVPDSVWLRIKRADGSEDGDINLPVRKPK